MGNKPVITNEILSSDDTRGQGADASAAGAPTAGADAGDVGTKPAPARAKRGFAVLSPEKKREIARMGGKAAHQHGRAHRFTSEEARAAGKKRHQMRIMAAAAAAQVVASQSASAAHAAPHASSGNSAGSSTSAAAATAATAVASRKY